MLRLILAIALWGMIHSLLASLGLKNFFRRKLGAGFMKFHRLLYNLFSVVSFGFILYFMITLPDKNLYRFPHPWSYLMRVGQVISALLLFVAVLQTDIFSFAGLRQLIEEEPVGKLVTRGLYRFVRHPLYTFSLLVLWLSPSMTVNSFFTYLALTIYVLVGAFFEERKLLREFGTEYADYRAVTPMLIPDLKSRRNK